MVNLFLLFCLALCQVVSAYDYTLSACAIFQDESRFLKEWIEYHRIVGVEHFWLYNNESEDNYQEVLRPYVDQGIVELIDWPSLIHTENEHYNHTCVTQTEAYNDALRRSRGISKWLAIIDVDEFILPVNENTVVDILEKEFPLVSGLRINWQCFGTSGVQEILPGELMIEKLTMKMPSYYYWNQIGKVIVQPMHVAASMGPHECFYTPNHWSVNTNKEDPRIVGEKILLGTLRINHYWTRDAKHFWEVKVPRYERWGVCANTNGVGILAHAAMMEIEEDTTIHRFCEKLQERMSSRFTTGELTCQN